LFNSYIILLIFSHVNYFSDLAETVGKKTEFQLMTLEKLEKRTFFKGILWKINMIVPVYEITGKMGKCCALKT